MSVAGRLRAHMDERRGERLRPPGRLARGLRMRFALLVSAILFLVALAVGSVFIERQARTAHDEMRRRAGALLETLSVPTAMAIAVDNLEQLDGHLAQLSGSGGENLGLRSVAMLDHEGRVIAHSERALLGAATRPFDPADEPTREDFATRGARASVPLWSRFRTDAGEPMLQVSMPAVSGLRWGTLVGTFDIQPVHAHIAAMRASFMTAFFVLALLIGLVLYIGVDRLVLRPLGELGRAARAVLSGDLAARARIAREDELGAVAGTFNAMAEELQGYTEALEERVTQRTAEVERKNAELESLNDELARLARTDDLTGLLNRRAFRVRLDDELRRSERTGSSLSVALLDIDFFKRVNDTWGHATGDRVLERIAQTMRTALRTTDVVARFGGEEFAVLLLDTAGGDALQVAEKLRTELAAQAHVSLDGEMLPAVTASIGVAVRESGHASPDELLRRADVALYAAKSGGRNRVILWRPGLGDAPLIEGRC